jgi:hypothetical protein
VGEGTETVGGGLEEESGRERREGRERVRIRAGAASTSGGYLSMQGVRSEKVAHGPGRLARLRRLAEFSEVCSWVCPPAVESLVIPPIYLPTSTRLWQLASPVQLHSIFAP